MTSLRKFSIVLLVVAALAALMAAPAQAQSVSLSCNQGSFPNTMTVGTTYDLSCQVAGGTPSYTFSISSGSVPSGMSTYQAGAEFFVEGTANALGTYSFTILVNDSAGGSNSQSFTVTVGNGTTGGSSVTLSSISPNTLTAGVATGIYLYGSGFTTNSTVYFNGSPFAATYYSTTELFVSIPAAYINAGTPSVYVLSSGVPSNTLSVTVTGSGTGGALSLTSLSPASVGVNSGSFTLYLFGSGFTQGQLVSFGNNTLSSTFISSSELSVGIPASYVTSAQTLNVSVAGSNALQFVVGTGGTTGSLTISCTNTTGPTGAGVFFSQLCSVSGGNGTYLWSVSGLPAGLSQSNTSGSSMGISGTPTAGPPYTYTISVSDSSGRTGTLTINGSSSTGYSITSLSPSSAAVNSSGITMSVFGNGFTGSSLIYFNGSQLTTQYVGSTQLNGTIPYYLLSTAGTFSVFVSTSGISTNSLSFTVGSGGTSGISLSSLSPTSVPVGSGAFTLTLFGSGFSQGSTVSFGIYPIASSYVNSNEVTVVIPSQYLTTSQTVNVSVGGSNSLPFVIGAGGTGSLSVSCSPTTGPTTINVSYSQTCSVSSGTAPFTWSVSGLPSGLSQSSYTGASSVNISGVPNTSQSYSYTVQVTDSSASHLTGSLTVTGTVGTSGSSYNITSLSPSSIAVGSASTTLTVFGNGFTGASYVYFNGAQLPTTYLSSTELSATLSSNYLTTSQSAGVYVTTSGIATNTLTFVVGSGTGTGGTLTVTCSPGIGPSTVNTLYTTTCTASGGNPPYNWPTPTNFPAYLTYSATTGSSITISGTPNVASVYNYQVKVTDSSSPVQTGALQLAGETTNSSTSTGSILLTSLSPSSAALNSASINLTVLGSGFSSNSQVIFDSFAVTTTFFSGSQLSAVIPAGLLTYSRAALVSVTTPGVGTSNSLTFIVGSGGGAVQMSISCTPGVGPATPNSYYTANCGVNGGAGPYNWSITSGSLPSGLTLSPNGPLSSISGYTSLNGTYSYTLQVTDSSSPANVATLVFAGQTGPGTGGTGGLTISSLSPTSTPVGPGGVTIAVYGSNFTSASLVYFNGSPVSTTYVSSGQLNATIQPGQLTVAQNASITVVSSGITSNALTFTVGSPAQTGITISCFPTVGPSTAGVNYSTTCTANGGKAPYNWSGLNLPFGIAVGNANGASTVSITGTLYNGSYNYTLQVTDSSSPVQTASYPFVGTLAGNATASISSISPISVPSGSGATTLVFTGTNFVSGVTSVLFGSQTLIPTVNSSTQLSVVVPSNLLASPGTINVQLSQTLSNIVGFFVTAGGASGVTPGSLSFVYGQGGTLPAAQTLTVTNLNGATGFSAVPSGQADGITWLALNQGSSTIPGSISVSVAPGNLPIGTYSGTITLTGFAVGTSVSIPVTLTVVGTPSLMPSSTNLTLTVPSGGSTTQTVNVSSTDGTTVIPFSITPLTFNGGSWLSVSPATGTTPGSFTITAKAANLTPSTYSGTVTLASTGSIGSQATISVTLVVTAPASITASPTSLSFSSQAGQGNPAAQSISVSASGNAAVNYSVAVATQTGSGWLTATQSGTTPGSISVSVNNANLTAGTYNGTVTITAPGTSNSPLTVPVTLVVGGGPALLGSPTSLSFTYQTGGSAPAAQSLTISAPSGIGTLSFSVAPTTTSGGNWLSVSPASGTTQSSVSVTVNPAGLAAGTYNGSLTATATGATTLTVPVTLVVSGPAATLTVSPTMLTFNAPVSGTAPASQTVAVSTTTNVAVNYTVVANSSGWLTSTTSGTTPGTLTVSVNQNGLAAGQYMGTLVITASGASNSPYTMEVILNVGSAASIVAVPSSLLFTVPADGSTPSPQSVTIISTGGNTSFTTSAVSQGGSWLTVTGGGTTPASVTATVNPTGLLPGQTYNGSITISAPSSNPTSLQIPVTLTVASQGPATLVVAPQSVYLSYTQGAGTDLQHIAVLNSGAGTVNFTAQVQTANCGTWLTIVTPTGSATASSPAVLAFDVNPTGLTSQTCRGTLAVNDGNGNITNVPVYMAISSGSQSVLLSQTVMNFVTQSGGSAPPAQTFQILNPGSGSMQWSISTKVLSGSSWLSVSPNSGSSQSLGQPGSPINVSVNPQGLAAGMYYGSLLVTSSGAFNSPQVVTVGLFVEPPPPPTGSIIASQVTPNGVILNSSTNSQTVNATNYGTNSVTFSSAAITDDGQNWLTVSPSSGTIAAGATNAITLSASSSGLSSGLRHGTLRIAFSDGNVQTVDVQLALSGSAGTGTTGVRACGSSNLVMEFLTTSQNFSGLEVGGAIPLQVQVQDCSGNLLSSSSTGVDVLVGSTDIRMNYIGNGVWTGTWTPAVPAPAVTLTARAVEITGGTQATGSVSVTGNVGPFPANGAPYVSAVVNAASFVLPGLVAPGTMVSIFGAGLADGQSQVFSTPFPNTLENAQFTLRGLPLPIFYASSGQVNAIIPTGFNTNERDQLLVVRDTTQSAPVDLLAADVDPGAFATNQQGTGQGAILVGGTSQLAAPAGSVPGAGPATAGQTVSIFMSGLGVVTNPPADGSPSSSSNPSTTTATPTVTIGGVSATVTYSGLAPGEVGLYQVNVQLPAGVPTGSAVPVVVTIGNGVANTVTMAIM